jgi:CRP-like cAMP-binding protein
MSSRSGLSQRASGDGSSRPTTAENNLIAKLPPDEFSEFLERAEKVHCALREMIFDINEPFDRVLFPISGMGSLVTVLKDGTMLEAQTVGREGFLGLPLFHGFHTARQKGMCQLEGDFYELSPDDFLSLLEVSPQLRKELHHYSQYSTEAIAQTAACNSMHLIEQRCARWLLTTADAVGRINFNLTQEFLSQMLAVRRPGVTVAMGALERQGLLEHRYGKVMILDVEGMKKVACECYATISDKARELLD